MNFDTAFAELLGHEGAYVNHPDDPGGETNWGITVAVARQHGYNGPMKDMPVWFAKKVYKAEYWDKVRAEEMPVEARYALFDAAVNSGTSQAIKWLQRAINVPADGVFGPVTLHAVKMHEPKELKAKMLAQRLFFMTSLAHWPTFGKGWARRIAYLMER